MNLFDSQACLSDPVGLSAGYVCMIVKRIQSPLMMNFGVIIPKFSNRLR